MGWVRLSTVGRSIVCLSMCLPIHDSSFSPAGSGLPAVPHPPVSILSRVRPPASGLPPASPPALCLSSPIPPPTVSQKQKTPSRPPPPPPPHPPPTPPPCP